MLQFDIRFYRQIIIIIIFFDFSNYTKMIRIFLSINIYISIRSYVFDLSPIFLPSYGSQRYRGYFVLLEWNPVESQRLFINMRLPPRDVTPLRSDIFTVPRSLSPPAAKPRIGVPRQEGQSKFSRGSIVPRMTTYSSAIFRKVYEGIIREGTLFTRHLFERYAIGNIAEK